MNINIAGFETRVQQAVKDFWIIRKTKGVRSGKTLDGFVEMIAWLVRSNGLPDAEILTRNRDTKIPGYFRPTKSWDVVVLNQGKLVAAIELKSIAASYGKNFNNRNEEALGSGMDVKEALAEDAFDGLTNFFTGYLILVEDCEETSCTIQIQMPHFRAMSDFMEHPEQRDTKYVKNKKSGKFPQIDGVSYTRRFEILCRRLVQKKLYSAAAVITSPKPEKGISDGSYGEVSADTSIRKFVVELAGHVAMASMI